MENNFAQNVLEYNFRHSSARIISITCEIKHGIILFKRSRTSNRIESNFRVRLIYIARVPYLYANAH